MTFFSSILGIVLIIALMNWIVGYNALIKYLNWVEEAWEDIDMRLKQRVDLVPPFVDVIQPYAKEEQYLLEKLVEIRSRITSHHADKLELVTANEEMDHTLKELFVVCEDNAEIMGNEEFKSLKEQFQTSEERLKHAIRIYDNTVEKYNMKIQSVPANFVASMHGFHELTTLGRAVTQED